MATNVRLAAVKSLDRVLHQGRSLTQALAPAAEAVGGADRALLQELVYGVLRQYGRLDALVGYLLSKPLRARDGDVRLLLLVGVYQLLELRVPPHAAVSETVQAAGRLKRPWAKGLVNAVLRRFIAERPALLERLARDPARHSHPDWLLDALRRAWPADWEAVVAAANERPPMTLRVNRRRCGRDAYLSRLREAGISAEAGVAPDAVRLAQPLAVDRLPGFAEGDVSVQDEAAQLAALLLDVPSGGRVLDACAAPGGKTGHILELQPEVAELVALDRDPDRLDRVRENLDRLGLRAGVVAGDAGRPADWWDGRPFERILLDAPCSGTGVIRRHPDIKWLRRADDIPRLRDQQHRLLAALWPLLAPEGKLVYSTCSILPDENENLIRDFAAEHGDASLEPVALAAGRNVGHGRQILPGELGMDGFYYACLSKQP